MSVTTHMPFFVELQHGSFCICKTLFCVILPFLVCCFLVRSMCWYQVSMYTFFTVFCTYQTCNKRFSANCIVTLVTNDVLCVIFYHLTHMCILSIFCFVKRLGICLYIMYYSGYISVVVHSRLIKSKM